MQFQQKIVFILKLRIYDMDMRKVSFQLLQHPTLHSSLRRKSRAGENSFCLHFLMDLILHQLNLDEVLGTKESYLTAAQSF